MFRTKRRPNGGDEEDRTPDPLLARQVLSQLSYTPIFSNGYFIMENRKLISLVFTLSIMINYL